MRNIKQASRVSCFFYAKYLPLKKNNGTILRYYFLFPFMNLQQKTKKIGVYIALLALALGNFPILWVHAVTPSYWAQAVQSSTRWAQSQDTLNFSNLTSNFTITLDGCTINWINAFSGSEDMDCTDGSASINNTNVLSDMVSKIGQITLTNYNFELNSSTSLFLTHKWTAIDGSSTIGSTGFDISVDNVIVGQASKKQIVDFAPQWPFLPGDIYRITINADNYDVTITSQTGAIWVVNTFMGSAFSGTTVDFSSQWDKVRVTAKSSWPFLFDSSVTDNSTPVLTEVTSIPSLSNNNTPNYVFNSTEDGAIGISGSCNLSQTGTFAAVGNNSPHLWTMPDGTYSDCTVNVTDAANHTSSGLTLSPFTIDTSKPTVTLTETGAAISNNAFHNVTATFSEDVSGVDYNDFNLNNWIEASGWLIKVDARTYTISFMALHEGTGSITFKWSGAVDGAGNGNLVSNSYDFTYDSTPPTIQAEADTDVGPVESDYVSYIFNDNQWISSISLSLNTTIECNENSLNIQPEYTGYVNDFMKKNFTLSWSITDESFNGFYLCFWLTDEAWNKTFLSSVNPLNIKKAVVTTGSHDGGGGGSSVSPNTVKEPIISKLFSSNNTAPTGSATTTNGDTGVKDTIPKSQTSTTSPQSIVNKNNVSPNVSTSTTTNDLNSASEWFSKVFWNWIDKPTDNLTRAEFLKKLFEFNFIDYTKTDAQRDTFKDVISNDWKAQVAYTALDLGIANGYEDGTFKPDAMITRIEALKFVLKLYKIQIVESITSEFLDVLNSWIQGIVDTAFRLWIIDKGENVSWGSLFHPNDQTTKVDAADMMEKWYPFRVISLTWIPQISNDTIPITNPLDNLGVNVKNSDGGVIQLQIDVDSLTR